jgi:tetratricopeptide (TPR) repeat protein/transcriptional regulator with XRE-family HTH domain
VKAARIYRQEAQALRARGCSDTDIVALWRTEYGINSRVAYRLVHGMTQEQLAQRWNEQWPSDSPKTGKQVSYWEIWPGEAGRAPSLETLNRLAFLFRCRAGDLLDGDDYSHLPPDKRPQDVELTGPGAQASGPGPHRLGPVMPWSDALAGTARATAASAAEAASPIPANSLPFAGPRPPATEGLGALRPPAAGWAADGWVNAGAAPDRHIAVARGQQPLTAALRGSHGPPITEQSVAGLQALTDTYRRLDYQQGAQRVTGDVTRHLHRLIDLTRQPAPTPVRRELLRSGADAAQLAAWLAIDRREYRQATRYCDAALSMAGQAGDQAMRAYTLGVMSYISLHAGNGRAALDILQAASAGSRRGIPAAVTSWLSEATAEAHAFLGDTHRGMNVLADSERLFDRVSNEGAPHWLAFFDADCHAARLKGRALLRLGEPRHAVHALHEALDLLPPDFVRERSGTLIDLAGAYVRLRDVESACDTAALADQLARQTSSERNRKRLRELLLEFLPWADQACVQALYHRILID